MKRRYFSLILTLLPLSNILAQTIEVEIEPVEVEGKTYGIVKKDDDDFHAIESAKCVFSVEEQASNILWYGPRIKKDGNEYATNWNEKHSGRLLLNIQESGLYELFLDSITYTSSDGNKETEKYGAAAVKSFQITFYGQPKLSSQIFTTQKEVIWDNTEKTFEVRTEGGYESGWKFKWMLDGKEVAEGSTWKKTLSAAEDSQELKVVIQNFPPDGKVPWYEISDSCSFRVYPYPKDENIELQYCEKQCPESMDWYCDDKSTEPISVSVDGYGDDWSCEWEDEEDKVVSNDKSFRPSIDSDKISSYDKGTAYTYTVITKIRPQGMEENLACKKKKSVTVNFWKTPIIKLSYDDYKVVFGNTEISVGFNAEGGIPGDKLYMDLFLDETSVGLSLLSEKFAFTPLEVGDRFENKTYHLRTRYKNDYSSVELKDIPIDLTIWKTPILHAKYRSNNPACNGSLIDAESEIFVCEKFESEAELHVDKEYGDNDGWTYSWVDCSEMENIRSTEDFLSIPIEKAHGNSARPYTYRLVVTNKPSGMDVKNQFIETVDFDFTICPTPSIDLDKIKSKYAGMHGDTLQLSIEDAIGVGGEWKYAWQKGDDSPIIGPTLDLINEGTEVIQENWSAKPAYYGPLGDIWYGDDSEKGKSLVVNIYPSPETDSLKFIGFDEKRIDAFYEGKTQYRVGFKGSYKYATNWVYTLSCNNEIRNSETKQNENLNVNELIAPLPFDEDRGYSQNEVKLQIECHVYDELADVSLIAYKQAHDLDYYAWRKGMAKKTQEEYPSYVYYEEEILLSVNPKFGYVADNESTKGGWEYEWTCNDSSINVNEPTYNYKCTNTTEKRKISYNLRCVNSLNGEVSYDSTFVFSFDEYARIIEATKNGVYPDKVREGDTVTLSVNAPMNGNPEGWRYYWEKEEESESQKLTDNTIPVRNERFELSSSGNEKYYESVGFTLHYFNDGPDGRRIGEYSLPFDFTVHRKPKLSDFMMKGNGTSSIYIAQSPSKDVSFEFGQGELPKGNAKSENVEGEGDEKNAQGEYMAFRYSSSPDNPWVRTFWDYGDFRCYSEPRDLKKKSAPSRRLDIEDGYFCVNLEEAVPATVTLYTLNGELVKEQHYAPRQEYAEKLDFDGISTGLYILKCTVGDMQVVKKFMIR